MMSGSVGIDGVATWVQLLIAVSGVVVPVLIVGIGVISTLKVSSSDTRDRAFQDGVLHRKHSGAVDGDAGESGVHPRARFGAYC